MREDLNTVFKFKSNDDYFWRERSDMKNNTVRKIDLNDDRFLDLIAWNQLGYDDEIQIELVCGKDSITRSIRDISIWNDLMIITWNEETLKKKYAFI